MECDLLLHKGKWVPAPELVEAGELVVYLFKVMGKPGWRVSHASTATPNLISFGRYFYTAGQAKDWVLRTYGCKPVRRTDFDY